MGLAKKPEELQPFPLRSRLAARARQQVLDEMLAGVKVAYEEKYGLPVEAESRELVRDADGALHVKTVYGGYEDDTTADGEDEAEEDEAEEEEESQAEAYKKEQIDLARLEAFIRCCPVPRQAESKQRIVDVMKEMGLAKKPEELQPFPLRS